MIKVNNLTRQFGEFMAVDDLSFSIPKGSICGFLGPNGAGKTTTIRMLVTLDNPTYGSAKINGHCIETDPDKVRNSVGYMPDYYGAYPNMTCNEYLDFFGRAYRLSAIERKKRIAQIIDFIELGPLLQKDVDVLSKGQRQKISLARILLPNPPVLILDEPAAGLDPRARIELRELLKILAKQQQKTILISSHILTELSDFVDSAIIIEEGKLRYHGGVNGLEVGSDHISRYILEVTSSPEEAQKFLLEQAGTKKVSINEQKVYWQVDESGETVDSIIANMVINAGIRFTQIYQQEEHLESLFLQITGKKDNNA
ncbi:MAG: ABC-2 type transport system ATP-binding protein [bacterium]|jgi:ABC-2 type transport system ATP-binding protein